MNTLKTLSNLSLRALVLLMLPAILAACNPALEPIQNTCQGVDCSGHGKCKIQDGKAVCICDQGYHAEDLACVEGSDPCAGVDCSGHGECVLQEDQAVCKCDPGYKPEGLSCTRVLCYGVTCSGHGTCVVRNDQEVCECEPGYSAEGLECLPQCIEDADCDDGNQCTEDNCIDGLCRNGLMDDPCDDGNACTENDRCTDGVCTGHARDCYDANPCSADSCDPATGCVYTPQNEGLECDDGNACTLGDVCTSAVCTGVLIDEDGDGIPPESCGGPDCDDSDPLISGATEALQGSWVCMNGLDDDCDGTSDADERECSWAGDLCDRDGWCTDSPFALEAQFVWGTGADDVWAAGNQGYYHFDGLHWDLSVWIDDSYPERVWAISDTNVWAIHHQSRSTSWLHWDGSGWSFTGLPEGFFDVPVWDYSFDAVWGSSSQDVWVGGTVRSPDHYESWSGSTILHWDGYEFTLEFYVPREELACWDYMTNFGEVAGSGPDDVWAVGICGLILHWDGNTWSRVESGTETWLNAIAILDHDHAWAVGDTGTIVRWDGIAWVPEDSGTTETLNDVLAFGADDIWAVGSHGAVLHRDGTGWHAQERGAENHTKVWGLAPDDIWICGEGDVLHWDGSGWTSGPIGCNDIWGAATNDIWASGPAHWDGMSWITLSEVLTLTREDLEDAFAEDNANVWAAGGSVVLRRDGATWVEVANGLAGNGLNAVWASGPGDAWVAGDAGHLAHFDGTTWTEFDSGTAADLNAAWGSSTDSVWAVGAGGVILHWNGIEWSQKESNTTATLMRVHGSSDTNVWVVGENLAVVHWDGQAWSPVELTVEFDEDPGRPVTADVLAFSADDVWVVLGDTSAWSGLHRWDGAQWSYERREGSRLGGASPDNVWLARRWASIGSGDLFWTISTWNGTDWTEEWFTLGEPLVDFAVTGEGSAIAVGSGGIILRYRGCRTDEDCHDEGTCFVGGTCTDGFCTGMTLAPPGSTCNDGVFCNGQDTCAVSGECNIHAGDPCGGLLCDEELDICKGETWYGLGGSDVGLNTGDQPGSIFGSPSLALDTAGNPVVAWCDFPGIHVMRYESGSWVELGTGINTNNCLPPLGPSLALDDQDRPVVVWVEDSGCTSVVYVRRFEGGLWVEVGAGSASGVGICGQEAVDYECGMSEWPVVTVDGDGRPLVAWHWMVDAFPDVYDGIYLRRFNGSEWEEVGAGSASAGGISDNVAGFNPSLALDGSGKPMVAWMRGYWDGVLNMKRFDGSAWVEVGAGSASEEGILHGGDGDRTSLAVGPGNLPVVACDTGVLEFDGSDWIALTGNVVTSQPSLAVDSSGDPVLASNNGVIHLRKHDGQSWVELGEGSGSGEGFSIGGEGRIHEPPSIAIKYSRICVAWEQEGVIRIRCVDE